MRHVGLARGMGSTDGSSDELSLSLPLTDTLFSSMSRSSVPPGGRHSDQQPDTPSLSTALVPCRWPSADPGEPIDVERERVGGVSRLEEEGDEEDEEDEEAPERIMGGSGRVAGGVKRKDLAGARAVAGPEERFTRPSFPGRTRSRMPGPIASASHVSVCLTSLSPTRRAIGPQQKQKRPPGGRFC